MFFGNLFIKVNISCIYVNVWAIKIILHRLKISMLKIAHIVGSLQVGGAERFVIDLSYTQLKSSLQPSIFSFYSGDTPLVEECKKLKIPIIVSYKKNKLLKLVEMYHKLRNFDVIHIHTPYALKSLVWILPYLNCQVIYTRHGAKTLHENFWVKLHLRAKKYVDFITFVSQEGMENFQKYHFWSDISHSVIDNGVIINPVNKVSESGGIVRIGSVGRMVPLKNQQGLLKAVNHLNKHLQDKIALHFFGDGECLKQLESYHNEMIVNVPTTFHGMVSDREKIYSNIDVLVVCSETEGLSMVIIEAMANNIPVIATNVGGNPKLVIDHKTGWLFDYDDDETLAKIMANIINEESILTSMGDNAFNYISENFSIQSSANKYAELYES